MLLCAGTLSAQKIADPGKIEDLVKLLEPQPKDPRLQCTVKIAEPTLNYAFQFESGYSFKVPLKQFPGPGHNWAVLTEVTPQDVNASPVYFFDTGVLQELVPAGSDVGASGGYRLGEGRYSVRWVLLDDLGRICRRTWQIDVRRNGKFVGMAPHTVFELSLNGTPAHAYTGSGTPMRITVLLDAAPLRFRRESPSRLRDRDREMLFDGLVGLMERLPTSSVRLIIFNLEQQEELLRQENFTLSQLDSVATALKDLQLGSVHVGVLAKPKGHIDLITKLLNAEIRSSSPSDAVVVLGPQERYFDKVPDGALEVLRGTKPLFFAVQFVPLTRWVLMPAEQGSLVSSARMTPITPGSFDTISKVIRKLDGKAFQVRTPQEFEKALQDIASAWLAR